LRELVVTTREPGSAVVAWQRLFGTPYAEDAVWLGDAWLRFTSGASGTATRVVVEVDDPDAVSAAATGRESRSPRRTVRRCSSFRASR
jgi:hypothetical protein